MKCKDCRFLGEPVKYINDKTGEAEPTRFHLCGLLKANSSLTGPDPSFFDWGEQPPTGVDAFPIDGSGYYAAFVVADDFGCVKFEPRS